MMFGHDDRLAEAVPDHRSPHEPGFSTIQSGIYTGPVFEMARRQFDHVADHLDIGADERQRIFLPKRAIAISCPIHRDDGSVAVFNGYRVQHHLTLGPTKGAHGSRPAST